MQFCKKNIANIITLIRLIGALVLIPLKPLSPLYFWVYTFCGLSDALDGWTARHFKITSSFGRMLDSCADLVFYAVMGAKLIPFFTELLPGWVLAWAIAIIALRVVFYAVTAIRLKKFASSHNLFNKATTVFLFFVPYAMHFSACFPAYATVTAIVATLALVLDCRIFLHVDPDNSRKISN